MFAQDLQSQAMTSFVLAALLWLCIGLARRTHAPGGALSPQLRGDLRAPQRILALYLVARLAHFFFRADLAARFPDVLAVVRASELFFGGLSLLRLADAVIFAAVRATRGSGQGTPRILRTLGLWAITFALAAAVLRSEFQADLSSVFATSALLSVVLGFALQETLGNLFAGLTLQAEQPFHEGEWVSFGKYTGRVLDVGWRSTRLLTLDEDELLVPNSLISREVVVNHSRPTAQDCVELTLSLDGDAAPARAKLVVLEALRGCKSVMLAPPPTVELLRFAEDGIDYRVRFHHADYGRERAVLDEVQQALWYGLRRAAIALPYPQTTISFREREAEAAQRRRDEHCAEATDLLSQIDFVAAMTADDRRVLAERARYLEFGPGEAVVRQGEAGEEFYLVAAGELSVRVQLAGNAGEKEVARLHRGGFFGEMSCLTGDPRTATVVATSGAALLAFDRDAFSRVFHQDPDVAAQLAHVIAGRKRQLADLRSEGAQAPIAAEERNLLGRIGAIFGIG